MLETLVALITLASLILYAVMGGADFGGGMWDLFATGKRAQAQRRLIAHALGPIWEANHVWLILVIVLLFTAFPAAFGAMMTALHLPLMAMLLGIVLRGSAFVFRKYDRRDDAVQRRWNAVFGVASLITPFLQGLVLGALASGAIRVEGGRVTTGFFAGWTEPFAIACGVFALGLFSFLAAVYLTVEAAAEPSVEEDFRARAIVAELLLAPLSAVVFFTAKTGAPQMFEGLTQWWAPWLVTATSACALLALGALVRRRYHVARAAAIGQVALILIGWSVAQFPMLIIPDVHIFAVAAPAITLKLLLGALAAGAVILLPSLWYLFRVFKGEREIARPAGHDEEH